MAMDKFLFTRENLQKLLKDHPDIDIIDGHNALFLRLGDYKVKYQADINTVKKLTQGLKVRRIDDMSPADRRFLSDYKATKELNKAIFKQVAQKRAPKPKAKFIPKTTPYSYKGQSKVSYVDLSGVSVNQVINDFFTAYFDPKSSIHGKEVDKAFDAYAKNTNINVNNIQVNKSLKNQALKLYNRIANDPKLLTELKSASSEKLSRPYTLTTQTKPVDLEQVILDIGGSKVVFTDRDLKTDSLVKLGATMQELLGVSTGVKVVTPKNTHYVVPKKDKVSVDGFIYDAKVTDYLSNYNKTSGIQRLVNLADVEKYFIESQRRLEAPATRAMSEGLKQLVKGMTPTEVDRFLKNTTVSQFKKLYSFMESDLAGFDFESLKKYTLNDAVALSKVLPKPMLKEVKLNANSEVLERGKKKALDLFNRTTKVAQAKGVEPAAIISDLSNIVGKDITKAGSIEQAIKGLNRRQLAKFTNTLYDMENAARATNGKPTMSVAKAIASISQNKFTPELFSAGYENPLVNLEGNIKQENVKAIVREIINSPKELNTEAIARVGELLGRSTLDYAGGSKAKRLGLKGIEAIFFEEMDAIASEQALKEFGKNYTIRDKRLIFNDLAYDTKKALGGNTGIDEILKAVKGGEASIEKAKNLRIASEAFASGETMIEDLTDKVLLQEELKNLMDQKKSEAMKLGRLDDAAYDKALADPDSLVNKTPDEMLELAMDKVLGSTNTGVKELAGRDINSLGKFLNEIGIKKEKKKLTYNDIGELLSEAGSKGIITTNPKEAYAKLKQYYAKTTAEMFEGVEYKNGKVVVSLNKDFFQMKKSDANKLGIVDFMDGRKAEWGRLVEALHGDKLNGLKLIFDDRAKVKAKRNFIIDSLRGVPYVDQNAVNQLEHLYGSIGDTVMTSFEDEAYRLLKKHTKLTDIPGTGLAEYKLGPSVDAAAVLNVLGKPYGIKGTYSPASSEILSMATTVPEQPFGKKLIDPKDTVKKFTWRFNPSKQAFEFKSDLTLSRHNQAMSYIENQGLANEFSKSLAGKAKPLNEIFGALSEFRGAGDNYITKMGGIYKPENMAFAKKSFNKSVNKMHKILSEARLKGDWATYNAYSKAMERLTSTMRSRAKTESFRSQAAVDFTVALMTEPEKAIARELTSEARKYLNNEAVAYVVGKGKRLYDGADNRVANILKLEKERLEADKLRAELLKYEEIGYDKAIPKDINKALDAYAENKGLNKVGDLFDAAEKLASKDIQDLQDRTWERKRNFYNNNVVDYGNLKTDIPYRRDSLPEPVFDLGKPEPWKGELPKAKTSFWDFGSQFKDSRNYIYPKAVADLEKYKSLKLRYDTLMEKLDDRKKLKLNKLRIKHFLKLSSGGRIPGQGVKDEVPALLTKGETVIDRKTSERLGIRSNEDYKRFKKAVAEGRVSKFASGGGDYESYLTKMLEKGKLSAEEIEKISEILGKINNPRFNTAFKLRGIEPVKVTVNQNVLDLISPEDLKPEVKKPAAKTNKFYVDPKDAAVMDFSLLDSMVADNITIHMKDNKSMLEMLGPNNEPLSVKEISSRINSSTLDTATKTKALDNLTNQVIQNLSKEIGLAPTELKSLAKVGNKFDSLKVKDLSESLISKVKETDSAYLEKIATELRGTNVPELKNITKGLEKVTSFDFSIGKAGGLTSFERAAKELELSAETLGRVLGKSEEVFKGLGDLAKTNPAAVVETLKNEFKGYNFEKISTSTSSLSTAKIRDISDSLASLDKMLSDDRFLDYGMRSERAGLRSTKKQFAEAESLRDRAKTRFNEFGALTMQNAAFLGSYMAIGGVQATVSGTVGFMADFDDAMKNLQAITGDTTEGLNVMAKSVKQVSTTTKFSALEIADAATIMGQAGFSATDISKSLSGVVQLATATGAKLEDSTSVLTSTLTIWDKSLSDSKTLSNEFTAAINESKLDVESLTQAIQYTGNIAASAKIPVEDVLTMTSLLKDAGIKRGSTLGTGQRLLYSDFAAPSKRFAESLKSVGIELEDFVKTFSEGGVYEALKLMKEKGYGLPQASRGMEMREKAIYVAAINQLDQFDTFRSNIVGTNAAYIANKTQMEGIGNKFKNMINSWQISWNNTLDDFKTPIRTVLDALTIDTEKAKPSENLFNRGYSLEDKYKPKSQVHLGVAGVVTAASLAALSKPGYQASKVYLSDLNAKILNAQKLNFKTTAPEGYSAVRQGLGVKAAELPRGSILTAGESLTAKLGNQGLKAMGSKLFAPALVGVGAATSAYMAEEGSRLTAASDAIAGAIAVSAGSKVIDGLAKFTKNTASPISNVGIKGGLNKVGAIGSLMALDAAVAAPLREQGGLGGALATGAEFGIGGHMLGSALGGAKFGWIGALAGAVLGGVTGSIGSSAPSIDKTKAMSALVNDAKALSSEFETMGKAARDFSDLTNFAIRYSKDAPRQEKEAKLYNTVKLLEQRNKEVVTLESTIASYAKTFQGFGLGQELAKTTDQEKAQGKFRYKKFSAKGTDITYEVGTASTPADAAAAEIRSAMQAAYKAKAAPGGADERTFAIIKSKDFEKFTDAISNAKDQEDRRAILEAQGIKPIRDLINNAPDIAAKNKEEIFNYLEGLGKAYKKGTYGTLYTSLKEVKETNKVFTELKAMSTNIASMLNTAGTKAKTPEQALDIAKNEVEAIAKSQGISIGEAFEQYISKESITRERYRSLEEQFTPLGELTDKLNDGMSRLDDLSIKTLDTVRKVTIGAAKQLSSYTMRFGSTIDTMSSVIAKDMAPALMEYRKQLRSSISAVGDLSGRSSRSFLDDNPGFYGFNKEQFKKVVQGKASTDTLAVATKGLIDTFNTSTEATSNFSTKMMELYSNSEDLAKGFVNVVKSLDSLSDAAATGDVAIYKVAKQLDNALKDSGLSGLKVQGALAAVPDYNRLQTLDVSSMLSDNFKNVLDVKKGQAIETLNVRTVQKLAVAEANFEYNKERLSTQEQRAYRDLDRNKEYSVYRAKVGYGRQVRDITSGADFSRHETAINYAQSVNKRYRAFDRANRDIELNFQRSLEKLHTSEQRAYRDLATSKERAIEDLKISESRAWRDYSVSKGRAYRDLAIQEQRAFEDLAINESRAWRDYSLSKDRAFRDLAIQESRAIEDLQVNESRAWRDLETQRIRAYRDLEINRLRAEEDLNVQEDRAYRDLETYRLRAEEELGIQKERAYRDLEVAKSRSIRDLGIDTARAREDAGTSFSRSVRNINIGSERNLEKISINTARALEDLSIDVKNQTEQLAIANERGKEDLESKKSRAYEDLGINTARAIEDANIWYKRSLEDLNDSVDENNDKLAIKFQRGLEDISIKRARAYEDLDTSVTRALEDVATGFSRKTSDLFVQQTRAIEDLTVKAERSRQDLETSKADNLVNIDIKRARGYEDLGKARTRGLEDISLFESRGARDIQLATARRTEDLILKITRAGEDQAKAEQRARVDLDTKRDRAIEDANRQYQDNLAALSRQFARTIEALDRSKADTVRMFERSLSRPQVVTLNPESLTVIADQLGDVSLALDAHKAALTANTTAVKQNNALQKTQEDITKQAYKDAYKKVGGRVYDNNGNINQEFVKAYETYMEKNSESLVDTVLENAINKAFAGVGYNATEALTNPEYIARQVSSPTPGVTMDGAVMGTGLSSDQLATELYGVKANEVRVTTSTGVILEAQGGMEGALFDLDTALLGIDIQIREAGYSFSASVEEANISLQQRLRDIDIQYNRSLEDLATMAARQTEDLNETLSRGLQDINTAQVRATEDLNTSVIQAIEDLDLKLNRGAEDLELSLARATEDLELGFARAGRDLELSISRATQDIGVNFARAYEDLATANARLIDDVLLRETRAVEDIELSMARAREDLDLAMARAREDLEVATAEAADNLAKALARKLEDIDLGSSRGAEDIELALLRGAQDLELSIGRATEDLERAARIAKEAIGLAEARAIEDNSRETAWALIDANTQYLDKLQDITLNFDRGMETLQTKYADAAEDLKTKFADATADLNRNLSNMLEDLKVKFGDLTEDLNIRLAQAAEDLDIKFADAAEDVRTRFADAAFDLNKSLARAAEDLNLKFTDVAQDIGIKFADAAEDLGRQFGRLREDLSIQLADVAEDIRTRFEDAAEDVETKFGRAAEDLKTKFDDLNTDLLRDRNQALADNLRGLNDWLSEAQISFKENLEAISRREEEALKKAKQQHLDVMADIEERYAFDKETLKVKFSDAFKDLVDGYNKQIADIATSFAQQKEMLDVQLKQAEEAAVMGGAKLLDKFYRSLEESTTNQIYDLAGMKSNLESQITEVLKSLKIDGDQILRQIASEFKTMYSGDAIAQLSETVSDVLKKGLTLDSSADKVSDDLKAQLDEIFINKVGKSLDLSLKQTNRVAESYREAVDSITNASVDLSPAVEDLNSSMDQLSSVGPRIGQAATATETSATTLTSAASGLVTGSNALETAASLTLESASIGLTGLAMALPPLGEAINYLAQQAIRSIQSATAAARGATPVKRSTGGLIPGYGGGDIVPALLEPGEFIVRKEIVREFGVEKLQAINMGTGGVAEEIVNVSSSPSKAASGISVNIGVNANTSIDMIEQNMDRIADGVRRVFEEYS